MGALIMQLFSVREAFLDCSKDIKMLLSRFASKSFSYLFLPFTLRPQPSGSDSCVWWEIGVQKCPLPLLPRRGFHFTQPRIWKDHPVPALSLSHICHTLRDALFTDSVHFHWLCPILSVSSYLIFVPKDEY